jgi:hypothetical protein
VEEDLMLAEIITFGGLIFWLITALVVLILAAEVENDSTGWATTTLGLYALGVVLFTDGQVMTWVNDNKINILWGAVVYLALAAVWALVKWRMFFLPKLFEKYDQARAAWLKTRGLKEMPADPRVRQEFMNGDVRYLNINHKRMASNNKGRILGWMVYWPASLLGTFFGDFLSRVFSSIYDGISGLMQGMSDRMASRYSELND